MEYDIIFDISREYNMPKVVVFSVVIIFVLVLSFLYLHFKDNQSKNRSKKIALFIVILVTSFIGINSLIRSYEKYNEYRNILKNGGFLVIEGEVKDFIPEPYDGHSNNESFTVSGIKFEYSYFIQTPGFHTTRSHGGPIKEGLYVRIYYDGNTILKLETRK